MRSDDERHIDRRRLLKWGGAAAAAPIAGAAALAGEGMQHRSAAVAAAAPTAWQFPFAKLEELGVADLRAALDARQLSVRELTEGYLARIEAISRNGPAINAIIETNPDALRLADELDRELASGTARGPLHGIPLVIKDNIDTADEMLTTAGSLALVNSRPARDATVAAKLRQAGALLLAKTTLSEWANFRSTQSASGWSGRGGQCRNPYALDRSPCGSSSGTPAALAASLAAAGLGTETDGSVVCPSSANSIAGIKPTVGLTSRAGVIPISATQDTVGPHGRTVADAAALLGAMTGVDGRDQATTASDGQSHADYTVFLDPDALRGARIGVRRAGGFFGYSPEADAIVEAAIAAMRALGAEIVDPIEFPSEQELAANTSYLDFLCHEFKRDLNAYLAERGDPEMRTLADLIAFNDANAAAEMPYFGQELFLKSEADPLTDEAYREVLATNRRLTRDEGIDAALAEHRLDAIVAPTGSPPWPIDLINGDHFLGASSTPSAMAGYPVVSVPAGYAFGLPVGISFIGGAWSEPTLIGLAHAFERAVLVRQPPRYLPSTVVPLGAITSVRAAGVGAAADEDPAVPPARPIATPQATPEAVG